MGICVLLGSCVRLKGSHVSEKLAFVCVCVCVCVCGKKTHKENRAAEDEMVR